MSWIILIASFFNIIIGVVVLARNPRRYRNFLLAILSFITAIWLFNNFMTGGTYYPSFWLRGAYAWGSLVIGSGFVWVLYLCNSKNIKWKASLIFVVSSFFYISSYVGSLMIAKIDRVFLGRFEGATGPLFVLYSSYFFVLALTIIIKLFLSYRSSQGVRRSQFLIILTGASVYIFISITVSFILPLFGYFKLMSLDGPSSLFLIWSMAYAISRYRFLNIRLVILRTLSFGVIVICITAIFAILSATVGAQLESIIGYRSDLLVGLIVGIIVTFTYLPVRIFVERVTNKFLFKETYDPDKLLSRVAEVTASILDLNNLLASICGTLSEAFHFQKVGIVLMDKKNKMAIEYKDGFKPGVAESLVSYPDIVKILYQELEKMPGILVIDEMKTRFDNGEFQPVSPELLTALHTNDIALIIPLYVQEKLIGVIALGNKKSGDSYNNQDLGVLKIISGQAAIAIENARLYDELKDFSTKLEEEVHKKTTQLRRANTELRQLDAAKSEFISIASHQLRTPLTVIKGYISMMREGSFGPVPDPIMTNLEKVYISNERLINLVENLLDISRIESGRQDFNWAEVHLEKIAAGVVEELKNNAKIKGLALTFHAPTKETPVVIGDEAKLHEVMMNFVDNAIKYTKEGSVDVYVKGEANSPRGTAGGANDVTFSVQDTGMGVSKEILPHLFHKFSRGKDSFRVHTEGVGLGLYVAKMLIDNHKGKIWVESEGEGKGSIFNFSVPVKGPNSPQVLPPIPASTVKSTSAATTKKVATPVAAK